MLGDLLKLRPFKLRTFSFSHQIIPPPIAKFPLSFYLRKITVVVQNNFICESVAVAIHASLNLLAVALTHLN